MGDGVQVSRGLLSCLEKNTNLITVLQGLGWFLYTNKMFTLVRVIVPGPVNCFVHGWCHGRAATYFVSLKACAGQHTARSTLALTRGQPKVSYTILRYIYIPAIRLS